MSGRRDEVDGLPCTAKDCHRIACVEPIVQVWPTRWSAPKKAANLHLVALARCSACAAAASVADLLSDVERERISDGFRSSGRLVPDWETARIDWRPMAGDVRALAAGGHAP